VHIIGTDRGSPMPGYRNGNDELRLTQQAARCTIGDVVPKGGLSCDTTSITTNCPAFTRSSKRRAGYPSETQVKRGDRVVHGDKELIEKLGRNDPCVCGSGRRFQEVLPTDR
jgi:uncharacterized protein YchJ